MYEDVSTNSVNTSYAVQGSGRCAGSSEINNIVGSSTLRKVGINYWLPRADNNNYYLYYVSTSGSIGSTTGNAYGVRPVVTLKSSVFVYANEGDETHTTLETAWNLN